MCGKFQGPLANGASVDRFLMANWAIYTMKYLQIETTEQGPFLGKTGACQMAQNGPMLKILAKIV